MRKRIRCRQSAVSVPAHVRYGRTVFGFKAYFNNRCNWCKAALSGVQPTGPNLWSSCVSYGFSIAPIPSSIFAAQSAYNATVVMSHTAPVTNPFSSGRPDLTSTGASVTFTTGVGNSGSTVMSNTAVPTVTSSIENNLGPTVLSSIIIRTSISASQKTTSAVKIGKAVSLGSQTPVFFSMIVSVIFLLHHTFF